MGERLARHFGWPWVDSDREIEASSGKPPAQWIQSEGQDSYRRLEQAWINNWQPAGPCILSTGGGLPCYQDNMRVLSLKARTIYLVADFPVLHERLMRPPAHILARIHDLAALRALHRQRHRIYQLADSVVSADQSPEAICEEIRNNHAGRHAGRAG